MDLRVYVDGVACIICDLTRTTTVHDIIIALAQYKGKAGRYSLIQRAPDGTQKTLSPNELTCELIHHSNWIYILQQNPSNKQISYGQKRSQSLDGQKLPIAEKVLPITSSFDHIRTVQHNKISHGFITLSNQTKKRSNIHQTFPSININTNNNNNNIHSNDSPISQKRLLRTPIHNSLENQSSSRSSSPPPSSPPTSHYSRPRSTVPIETSAFHIIHNPNRQQYNILLQLIKNQDIQVKQQENDLNNKQNEIDYRETILHQTQLYQDTIQHELKLLEEHDKEIFSQCQIFSQEYSIDKLNFELEYHQKLNLNYEHLQQQLIRCTTTFEQKQQLQEQLQFNIKQIHDEIQQIQTNINNDKKEILQCEYDLECSNDSLKQQEDLEYILNQRNEDIERFIQQHQKQVLELELELMKCDNLLLNNFVNSSYHFHPTSSENFTPVHLQFMNSTLLKLCPSGIWV